MKVFCSLALLAVLLLLQGCAGVVVATPRTSVLDGVSLARERGKLLVNKTVGAAPSAEKVRQRWGEPDSISTLGDLERWRYTSKEYVWGGITPIVVVPLPLVVPLGHKAVLLEFRQGQLVRVLTDNTRMTGGVCGLLFVGPCAATSLSCQGDWHDKETTSGLTVAGPSL